MLVTTDGLVAPYSVQVTDGSPYGNHGELTGGTVTAGMLTLAGTGRVSVGLNDSLGFTGGLTVEAWTYPTLLPTAGGRRGVVDHDGVFGLFLYESQGEQRARCTAAGAVALSSVSIPLSQWTHLACVYDGAALRLYIDGVLDTEVASAAALNAPAGEPLAVGANSPSGDGFVGQLDGVRLWSRARSEEELCGVAQACTCWTPTP